MSKELSRAFLIFILLFSISQIIKYGFSHFDWNVKGPIMSLELTYNHGVAFSMFAFLSHYLKYIQLIVVFSATIYLFKHKEIFKEYYIPIALLYAGGLSNILDRFTYGAVVDFFYWHYGFEFAIFNLADVIINLAVAIILYKQFTKVKNEKKLNKI